MVVAVNSNAPPIVIEGDVNGVDARVECASTAEMYARAKPFTSARIWQKSEYDDTAILVMGHVRDGVVGNIVDGEFVPEDIIGSLSRVAAEHIGDMHAAAFIAGDGGFSIDMNAGVMTIGRGLLSPPPPPAVMTAQEIEAHRLSVQVTAFEDEGDDTFTLAEWLSYVREKIKRVPREYRSNAMVYIGAESEWLELPKPTLVIKYNRPETDDEVRGRVGRERADAADREAKERRAYEKLKAKFEGK